MTLGGVVGLPTKRKNAGEMKRRRGPSCAADKKKKDAPGSGGGGEQKEKKKGWRGRIINPHTQGDCV